jgi:hypothetical protein
MSFFSQKAYELAKLCIYGNLRTRNVLNTFALTSNRLLDLCFHLEITVSNLGQTATLANRFLPVIVYE